MENCANMKTEAMRMFENRKRGIKSVELKSRMREQILLEDSETNKKTT